MAPDKSRLQQLAQDNPRISGFVTLLIGLIIVYFSIIDPVIHAQVGAHVSLSGKGGIGGAMFIAFGAYLIIFGAPALAYVQSLGTRPNIPVLVAGALLLVTYIGALELLKSYLRSNGYVV